MREREERRNGSLALISLLSGLLRYYNNRLELFSSEFKKYGEKEKERETEKGKKKET